MLPLNEAIWYKYDCQEALTDQQNNLPKNGSTHLQDLTPEPNRPPGKAYAKLFIKHDLCEVSWQSLGRETRPVQII